MCHAPAGRRGVVAFFSSSRPSKLLYGVAMSSQKDIFHWAQTLITEHGEDAEAVAERWMQTLMDENDAKGAGMWLSIMSAIADLRAAQHQKTRH